ncbi:leucyl aminopeptidase family protein [Roseibium aquae]|uniref:leucyl aminopeptidase family protein n=1 Tax=Roseibium aquae TaxID=1323746 RepID=UPI003CC7D00B
MTSDVTGEERTLHQAVWDFCRLQGFEGKAGTAVLANDPATGSSVALLGLSEEPNTDPFAIGAALARLPAADYALPDAVPDLPALLLGFGLSSYRFTRYRPAQNRLPRLVLPSGTDTGRVAHILAGVNLARDLINTPANDLGPAELAFAIRDLFEAHGGTGEIIEAGELVERGFPMVHTVGRASSRPPRLADYSWGDEAAPKVTLVGKGVVFDTGGLDIKPSNAMLLMKKDMGGAANVLGLAAMIMAAKLPVRLRVVVPCVENAVSGEAFRPGDVLRSRKGFTVEIGNTDAEGRLVLADALALADEEEPDLLIDMATLTGAARVALGPDLPPFFTPDDDLAEDIAMMADAANDPLWRLPLWQPYMKYLESRIADINHVNTAGAGFAGSITAALFLSRFVEKAGSWVHFDIYGWVPIDKPGRPVGGEAQGIRALFDLICDRYGDPA